MPRIRFVLFLIPLFNLAVAWAATTQPASAESGSFTAAYTGRRISLDLYNADLRSVFSLLGDVSQENFVVHSDVQGTVKLTLKDVPWDQVLDIVCRQHQLYALHEGNVYLIVPIARVAEMLR